MAAHRIQSLSALENEMRAVARGVIPAPADAASPSFESVEALARLLTPDNRVLLGIIRDRKPRSLAELTEIAGPSQPNLLQRLETLRDAGLVRIEDDGGHRVPSVVVTRIIVEIDPYSANDRVHAELAQCLGFDGG